MKRNIIQNNCLLNTKNNKSTINNKRLFPNIHLVKNINKNNNDKKIYSELKILPKQKERVLSQTNINAHNGINNYKVKFGIHNKKNRLHFSQSEINIKSNNKNNFTNITSDDNKDYINSIYSNGEKIASLTKMKPNEIDKNFSSHNEIISDLLNKTEKLFDDLGMFLEQRNKKLFGNLNENNVIQSKKFLGLATKRNNLMFSPKRYQSKNIINNYNDKNSVRLKYNTILSSFKRNKSYATMNSFNENKNKKSVTDAIIQTLNTSEDNKQSTKEEQEEIQNKKREIKLKSQDSEKKNENNNILPLLSQSIEITEPKKMKIKIAEVKKVYPVYPFNRIIKLNPSFDKNNKFNFNIHRKDILDMRDIFRHDDRYNYLQLMNNIKYKSVNKKASFVNYYKLKSSLSFKNKKISKSLEKIIKLS
jgi:hypothetical protein